MVNIKVVDRCCALIGEIKALSVTTAPFKPAARTRLLLVRFSDALTQALFYCAVHFPHTRQAEQGHRFSLRLARTTGPGGESLGTRFRPAIG
jgi:hypothetical protein